MSGWNEFAICFISDPVFDTLWPFLSLASLNLCNQPTSLFAKVIILLHHHFYTFELSGLVKSITAMVLFWVHLYKLVGFESTVHNSWTRHCTNWPWSCVLQHHILPLHHWLLQNMLQQIINFLYVQHQVYHSSCSAV